MEQVSNLFLSRSELLLTELSVLIPVAVNKPGAVAVAARQVGAADLAMMCWGEPRDVFSGYVYEGNHGAFFGGPARRTKSRARVIGAKPHIKDLRWLGWAALG